MVDTRRKYTRKQKLTAVLAADMTNTEAAAMAAGIPRSTLQYWMDGPEFVAYRQKTRDDLGAEIKAVAHLALRKLMEALQSGTMEPRDVTMAFGVLIDKAQLLSGHATERIETRDITESLNDHERQALRDSIERWLEETAPVSVGVPALGAGAEVRQ